MNLRLTADLWDYLGADETIDIEHDLIVSTAAALRTGDDLAYAQAAFEFVRDEITHSLDSRDHRVTWRASDVLRERTGLCYAKSHLYVALLRAAGIEAGLCYQRLASKDTHVIHGLAAALLQDRWIRLDPRGGNVEFSATEDRLAYTADPDQGEIDYPTVYASPHPTVLAALRTHNDCLALCEQGHLPTSL